MAERVVVSLTSADQEYQALQAAEAREFGREQGVDVEVLFAEDNAVRQIQQLFRFVHSPEGDRPVALLVHTRVADGLERVARNAVRAGMGWVLLNRAAHYLEGLRSEHPLLAVAAVTTDHLDIGRIHARQLERLAPDGGQVLYLQGPVDAPAAALRLQGFEDGLRGRPFELKVLNGEWTEASGEKAVAAWLRLKTAERFAPRVVVCQNDNMARGARTALARLRPEWSGVPFVGCDGLPGGGQRDVDEGRLAATVVIPSCARPALELLVRQARRGEALPLVTVLSPTPYPAE